jgi:DNA-binding MarR family transcriptional regulator
MRAHGAQSLTTPQFRALLYLHRHPSGCLSDLAEHLGVTNPTASSIVERLVRRELTNRAPDPNERRRVLLTVTPRGEEHLETARTATRNRLAGILATLAPVERQQITAGLALLREAVEGVGSHAQ